jgi:hypothetical protein
MGVRMLYTAFILFWTLVTMIFNEIVKVLPLATGIAIVLTLFATYLYPGKIIFQRPSQITFSKLEFGGGIEKDIISIPIAVSYTGALSSNFQVALIMKLNNDQKFDYGDGHSGTYAILTNDFETKSLRFSEIQKVKGGKFQDKVEIDYSTGFSLKSRDRDLKICMFYPVNNELKCPISGNGGQGVTMYLLYRKKTPCKKQVSKLRDSDNCSNHISSELDSRFWGWRYGFEIRWEIPEDSLSKITICHTLSVTRFEYHRFRLFSKFLRKVPTLLMCEDT